MGQALKQLINYVVNGTAKRTEAPKEEELDILIQKALKEREVAQRCFENATDPDLIDHAIYLEQAANQKYLHLLKMAKEKYSSAQ